MVGGCVCVLLLFVRVTGGRLLCVCVCATAVCQSNWW